MTNLNFIPKQSKYPNQPKNSQNRPKQAKNMQKINKNRPNQAKIGQKFSKIG